MFSLGVSPREIQDTLFVLKYMIYPDSIKLAELTRIIFGTSTDIQQRKVRLAIAHLRKLGFLIIGEHGYYMASDDPEPVIHFINGMYSRAHSLTTDADIMYHGLKQKYGDAVSAKVKQLPNQPWLDITSDVKIEVRYPCEQDAIDAQCDRINREPPYRKSIDAIGNEITRQFEYD